MARPWAGRLFLDAGTTLFIGPGGAADRHAHHAVQLVWARAGTLSLTLDRSVRRRAALIAADTPHAFDASGADLALMLVDPHGARGRALH
ncbi:MAG: AraC family transcriptional regulator, partial [Deltaproteobacteria bacterium]|nr:AraC family transcriptional regulator [Kofleriaceae bacterium]